MKHLLSLRLIRNTYLLVVVLLIGSTMPAKSIVSYSFNAETGMLTVTGAGNIDANGVNAAIGKSTTLETNTTLKTLDLSGYGGGNIGNYAFVNCIGLSGRLIIPEGVSSIGTQAFMSSNIAEVSFPSTLNAIGTQSFYLCNALAGTITIPANVTSIMSYAFDVPNIKRIICHGATPPTAQINTLPSNNVVVQVPAGSLATYKAASYWKNYNQIWVEGAPVIKNIRVSTAGTLSTLLESSELSAINELIITGSLNDDDYRFLCPRESGVSPFAMPNRYSIDLSGVTDEEIPGLAFLSYSYRNRLIDFKFPSGVKTIGSYAFSGCVGLTRLDIPNSVTTIEGNAFYGCSGLTTLRLSNNVETIGEKAFYGCTQWAGELHLPTTLSTIGSSAFYNCEKLSGTLVLPSSLTTLNSSIFRGCSGFSALPLLQNLTLIENDVFYGCVGMKGKLTIPDGVLSIGMQSFYYTGFDELILGAELSSIGGYALSGSAVYTSITCKNPIPPTTSYEPFPTTTDKKKCVLHIPEGESVLAAYKGAGVWKDFVNILQDESTGITTTKTNAHTGIWIENNRVHCANEANVRLIEVYSLSGKLISNQMQLPEGITGPLLVQLSMRDGEVIRVKIGK